MSRRSAHILALLCLLAAAALRLPDLTLVPPGAHFDEAANALLAAEMGRDGNWPLFITSYTGKEALFFYLAAGVMSFVGQGLFSLRLTAALIGLLTVAATYWLAREMYPRHRAIAVVAMLLLAANFSHLLFSRLGFRAISQPLMQTLAVAAFWRGWRRSDSRWLASGGAALGLTAYTYLAARLFPVALALGLAPLLLAGGAARRRLLVYAGGALVVAAPLLLFFVEQPALFWVRIDQVAPGGELSLPEAYRRSLGMLFQVGDPYWRFNLPGRPLLSSAWGFFFVAGWLSAVWRAASAASPLERAAGALLAVAPAIMLLPTALATGEILPSNLRAIGLFPFITVLAAAGLDSVLRLVWQGWLLVRRYIVTGEPLPAAAPWWRATPLLILIGLLALETLGVRQAYFEDWAERSDVFYETEADLGAVSRYIDALPEETTIFVAARHYRHPTVALQSERYESVRWLPDSLALPIGSAWPAVYVYPHSAPPPAWVESLLAEAIRREGPAGPDGAPLYVSFEVSQAPELIPDTPLNINFENRLLLSGINAGGGPSGSTLPLTLFWQPLAPASASLQPFIHLEDAWGGRWGQAEPFAYPAEQWRPGETVVLHLALPIAIGTPPGLYQLRIGFFEAASGARLARLDGDGRYAGSALSVASIPVSPAPPPDPLPQPSVALDIAPVDGLDLVGVQPGPPDVAAGSPYPLEMWWQALRPLPRLTMRLELMRPDGTGVILADTQPVYDTYPFAVWDTPLFLKDRQAPRLPVDLAPGPYTLRLRLLEGMESRAVVPLAPLMVRPSERSFALPRPQTATTALFGGEIALLGYDLGAEEGERRLTLYWQAERVPAANYTVFVHLLRPDGSCCTWQVDRQPRAGAAPTAEWLPGEVVADSYVIPWPPAEDTGEYPLEIGLYVAESGRRLRLEAPGATLPDAYLFKDPLLNRE